MKQYNTSEITDNTYNGFVDSLGNPITFGNEFMQMPNSTIPDFTDPNFQSFDLGVDTTSFKLPAQGTEQSEGMFGGMFSNNQGGQGWGLPALGAATGVAQTFLGFKQLSEGKRQNRIANNQWQAQFDIQKQEYDRRVSERNARVAASNANKQKASLGG